MILKTKYLLPAFLCFLLNTPQNLIAQLNPMGALYFQNQYLGNPAMVGRKGLDLNMGFRKQFSSLQGGPTSQTLTGEYAFASNAGVGLKLSGESSGLFKSLRSVASYAYHLPLNENNSTLSFGLSLGFLNERVSQEDINGDPNDVMVANYNQRQAYVDGDFGMAYTNNKFTVQAALPNMKGVFKRDLVNETVDLATFFSAISYKIVTSGANGIGLETKMAYRGIKGLGDILDIGANLTYANDRVYLFGMYHSSQSATFGLGMNYQSFSITGMYTTTSTPLANYTSGNFEIGLKANIIK